MSLLQSLLRSADLKIAEVLHIPIVADTAPIEPDFAATQVDPAAGQSLTNQPAIQGVTGMSTLNEVIQAEITAATNELATVKAKYDVEIKTLEARIATAKGHLSAFGPWLHHEVDVAKKAIGDFFAKFGL